MADAGGAAKPLHLFKPTIETELGVMKSVPSSLTLPKSSLERLDRAVGQGGEGQVVSPDDTGRCSPQEPLGLPALLCPRLPLDEGSGLKSCQERHQRCLLVVISPEELFREALFPGQLVWLED